MRDLIAVAPANKDLFTLCKSKSIGVLLRLKFCLSDDKECSPIFCCTFLSKDDYRTSSYPQHSIKEERKAIKY